jgi:serine/threonine protein kinase
MSLQSGKGSGFDSRIIGALGSNINSSNRIETLNKNIYKYLANCGYRLLDTIGNGSYAKVKLAEQISKNGVKKKLAVKIINRLKAPDDFLIKFLPRELQIYEELNHPNIIKVNQIFQISHLVFIFMELAEQGDLLDFMKVRAFCHLFI